MNSESSKRGAASARHEAAVDQWCAATGGSRWSGHKFNALLEPWRERRPALIQFAREMLDRRPFRPDGWAMHGDRVVFAEVIFGNPLSTKKLIDFDWAWSWLSRFGLNFSVHVIDLREEGGPWVREIDFHAQRDECEKSSRRLVSLRYMNWREPLVGFVDTERHHQVDTEPRRHLNLSARLNHEHDLWRREGERLKDWMRLRMAELENEAAP